LSHAGRQNLLQEPDGAQAQYFFKGIRRLSALANRLAGSTPEDAEALAQILHGPGLSAKPEEIA